MRNDGRGPQPLLAACCDAELRTRDDCLFLLRHRSSRCPCHRLPGDCFLPHLSIQSGRRNAARLVSKSRRSGFAIRADNNDIYVAILYGNSLRVLLSVTAPLATLSDLFWRASSWPTPA